METSKQRFDNKVSNQWLGNIAKITAVTVGVMALLVGLFAVLVLSQTSTGQTIQRLLAWLMAADTPQATWYITRAAGLTGFLLLWFSTLWGLVLPSKILDGFLHGTFSYDFHQFISLLAIGFIALHIIVLTMDQYLPFSVFQLLVPFTSTYRPVWVSFGIFSLYLILLVTITFYIRDRIGSKAFRSIHYLSLIAFAGAAIHGLYSGTDSPLPAVQLMYAGTSLSVLFMTVYWLVIAWLKRSKQKALKA